MECDTNEFDSMINQVIEKYSDVFDWVFDNLVKIEENDLCDSSYTSDQCDLDANFNEFENDSEERDQRFVCFCDKSTQTEESFDEQSNDSFLKQNNEILDQIISVKKPRGRPRKYPVRPQRKSVGQLWEVLLDLLNNRETNPSLIRWLSRKNGLFKLIQSEKVAKIWGDRRTNPRMNYKKMSRTIRHYYKKKIMIPVYGRKLVYQFGPDIIKYRINS